jgi:epoxide hydrolase-like predicted phosphatase
LTIKTVAFDMGGVLTFTSFGGLEEYGSRLGVPDGTFTGYFRGHPMMAQLEKGEIASRDFFKFVCADCEAATGIRVNIRELAAAAAEGEVLNPDMMKLVGDVRGQCATALLTNNVAEAGWRSTFPFELFDWVIDSSAAGVRKPDPRIYQQLIIRSGSAPQEIVFIDDLAENLIPARELGIHAVEFAGSEALRRTLTTLGISV